MPFAGEGVGTAWETGDKPALFPPLVQSCLPSTSRAGPYGFCQGCSDSVPASVPGQESVFRCLENSVSAGSVWVQGKDQRRSLVCVLTQP